MKLLKLVTAGIAAAMLSGAALAANLPDGSKDHPLRVLMVPADTGTNDITADYAPVFKGITEHYGIHFDLRAGASYAAVVEGMCNDQADIAWYGAVTFGQANEKCGVDLLAVDVKKGNASYHSGIFVAKDSGINSIADLKNKSMAFGSPNSTSSFNFPVAMLIADGVDPTKDLKKLIIAGSHSASLAALAEGKVDAAAASYNSFGKAVKKGAIDPAKFKPLAKSQPIPNPPLAMNRGLTDKQKAKLRLAFSEIHTKIDPAKIRGYGGKKVDRYDTDFDVQKIFDALGKLSAVTKQVKADMIDKAGQR
ncbi:MAG: phosphonate ABC transporter substrate-binding protein [gamma proteobacterium symbiont of Ctena orbiculata]|nr:MAG: phosphonate ABC transporter substrate-binding protein [gamma proteobacterium symbiont of Ctena orbiculata]PVV24640.1 MAG: phosphonate ABC transporter substrate-binding protein [gamma proteobacterium symbiont of Ctena orbiculata]